MADYDFTACLSPLDFELLSKDLLEAELGIQLENFSEGRDGGIDLRYAPIRGAGPTVFGASALKAPKTSPQLIVQCKRYSSFANLKSELKRNELPKISKLNPARYILTTSVSLSPMQADELVAVLSPFVQTTGDIYGRERLNSILGKHSEIERRHIKLWASSAGVFDSIIHAGTHVVSREEIERTIAAAKLYVRNASFDEALKILKKQRVCIISGLPGIGKTTLARMLMLYFYEKGHDLVKIESDISEARAVSYHNKPRFFYYDDFLGQTAQADKLNKNEDQKLLDFMASIRDSKDSVFVLTTREYILNQAKLHYEKLAREKFDHRTCVIDLSKYSRRIRAQILYNHLHFSSLPRPHLENLVTKRGYVRIVDHRNYNPRLIQYLTDIAWIGETPSTGYLELFIRNLDNPVEIWNHAFRNQISDRSRHLLFVLVTMPPESLLPDVEKGFVTFHKAQCARFGIAHSATDFEAALRELDGTFVATRRVQGFVLVRFQNPSIRDFMQTLLLEGEQFAEVIESFVFFEQPQWLMTTLLDDRPGVSISVLASHARKIVNVMMALIDAGSCTVHVSGNHPSHRVSPQSANAPARLGSVARALAGRSERDDTAWIDAKASELSARVAAGTVQLSVFDGPLRDLAELGCLSSDAGKNLVSAIKQRVLTDLDELDGFEALGNLVSVVPTSLVDAELAFVREAYAEFAERFVEDRDSDNPDEIRSDAARIGNIGDVLGVDTDTEQVMLRDFASEIETANEKPWEGDDERRWAGNAEECLDRELDSMFGTLKE